MNNSNRGERCRSIRMLLAGGSALATVMVLGTHGAYALTATTEELAALDGSIAVSLSAAHSSSAVWGAPSGHDSEICGDVVAQDGWAAGRYQELAAVGGIDGANAGDGAPQPSFGQLNSIGEALPAEKLAHTHALAQATPAAGEPDPLVETPRAQRVREFEELAAIESAELDNLRGGFSMGGVVVSLGFELKNTLNGILVDHFFMPPTNLGSQPVAITHTQTSQDGLTSTTTTLNSLTPAGGLLNRSLNNGQTTMAFSLNNGVMSLIQNKANSQTIQSQANINLNVSGLGSSLRAALGSIRTTDAIRQGSRFRR